MTSGTARDVPTRDSGATRDQPGDGAARDDSTSPPRGVLFLSVATVLALMGTPALAVKPLVGRW